MAKPAGKVPDHLRSEISLRVHPQDWLAKARKLKKAADLLFRNFETEQVKFNEEFEKDCDADLPRPDDTVVTMLLGFAVENLLKGPPRQHFEACEFGEGQGPVRTEVPWKGTRIGASRACR